MKRHLAIADYALGALRRRRGRSTALSLGIAFVVFMYGSGVFVVDALRAEVAATVGGAPDLTVQRLVAGRPALVDERAADALLEDPAVRSVRPRVWGFLYVPAIESNIVVVGSDELPVDADGPVHAAAGHALAERLALRGGDRLALPGADGSVHLHIDRVRGGETALHDADVLEVDPAGARRLLGVPEDEAVDLALTLVREEEASVVGARASELIPGARVIDRNAMVRAYDLTFDGRGGLLNALLLPCLAALLLLAWERLTGLGATERREIAILKANGWHTSDVVLSRVYESLLIGIFGALLGALVAYAYVFLLHAPGLSNVLFGWSVLHADLKLVPAIDAATVCSLLAIVVVPFVAVGIVPAWRAAVGR